MKTTARKSSTKIYEMFCQFKVKGTSLVWTWRGNSWKWVLQESRRYANHSSGRKYYQGTRKVRPQDKDWRTNTKAKSAAIFKEVRDKRLHTILNTKR